MKKTVATWSIISAASALGLRVLADISRDWIRDWLWVFAWVGLAVGVGGTLGAVHTLLLRRARESARAGAVILGLLLGFSLGLVPALCLAGLGGGCCGLGPGGFLLYCLSLVMVPTGLIAGPISGWQARRDQFGR